MNSLHDFSFGIQRDNVTVYVIAALCKGKACLGVRSYHGDPCLAIVTYVDYLTTLNVPQIVQCDIWGSHNRIAQDSCRPGCYRLSLCKKYPTFRRLVMK
jgi:hypothetical protein